MIYIYIYIYSRAGVVKNAVSVVHESELLKLRNGHFQDRVLNKEVCLYEELITRRDEPGNRSSNFTLKHYR